MNKSNLLRILRNSVLANSKGYHFLRYLMKRKGMNKAIEQYLHNTQVVGEKVQQLSRSELRRKMQEAMVKYHWEFNEFFIFRYVELSHEGRMRFLPEYEKNIFADTVNDKKMADIMKDKWKTYLHLKEFFHRDACYLQTASDIEKEDCNTFVTRHPRFMLKPNRGTCGKGIQILDTQNTTDAQKQLHAILGANPHTTFILEEIVEQDPRMAAFHQESLNTLRMSAICYGDTSEVIHPRVRFGRGNAIVDNGGSGGILALVDAKTGIITMAYDELGNHYSEHPDTHLPIVGFQIPEWKEAVDFVNQVFQHCQGLHYCGWDIALSTKGWVLIEGNDNGQMSFQQPTREGFRPEMEEIIKKLNNKESKI